MLNCGCSIGIVVLTVVYGGFVFAIDYSPLDVPECLHEPCNSEGVDNYTLNWATDFFVALALLLFALHLLLSKQRRVLKTAILTQLFMCGAFVQFGLAHMMYPNDGTGDAKGLRFYWILSWIAYFFLTLSTMTLVAFAEKASPRTSRQSWWGKAMLRFFLGLVVSFSVAFLVGCIWCGISPEIHVNEIIDEYDEIVPHPKCVRLIEASEIGWRVSYALLWIPASLLLRAAANRNPETFLSLPSPCAPLDLILIQSTIGFVFHVWIKWAAHALVYDETELFENMYGSVVIHYGMLLTFYMLHGLSMSLAKNIYDSKGKGKNRLEKMEEGEKSVEQPLELPDAKSSRAFPDGLEVSKAKRKQKRKRKQAFETENKPNDTAATEHKKPSHAAESAKLSQKSKLNADTKAHPVSKGVAGDSKTGVAHDVEDSMHLADFEQPGTTHEVLDPRRNAITQSTRTDAAVASESALATEFSPEETADNFVVSSLLPGATVQAMTNFHQAANAAVQAAVESMQQGIQFPAAFNFAARTDSPTSPTTDSDQQTVSTYASSDAEHPQRFDTMQHIDRINTASETEDAELQGNSKRAATMESNHAPQKHVARIDTPGSKYNERIEIEKDTDAEVQPENSLGEKQESADNYKGSPRRKQGNSRAMQRGSKAGRAKEDEVSKTRLSHRHKRQPKRRQRTGEIGDDTLIPPWDATVRSKIRPDNHHEDDSTASPSFYVL